MVASARQFLDVGGVVVFAEWIRLPAAWRLALVQAAREKRRDDARRRWIERRTPEPTVLEALHADVDDGAAWEELFCEQMLERMKGSDDALGS